jgi:hypothetical protein
LEINMKGEKGILIGLAVMAAITLGCGASAQVGQMPTPMPAPTAQPPQVIVVQAPAQQQPTAQPLDTVAVLILSVLLVGSLAAMTLGISLMVMRHGQKQQPMQQPMQQPPTYILPPPEFPQQARLTEAEHFRILRQAGMSPEQAMRAIDNSRWQQLPPAG